MRNVVTMDGFVSLEDVLDEVEEDLWAYRYVEAFDMPRDHVQRATWAVPLAVVLTAALTFAAPTVFAAGPLQERAASGQSSDSGDQVCLRTLDDDTLRVIAPIPLDVEEDDVVSAVWTEAALFATSSTFQGALAELREQVRAAYLDMEELAARESLEGYPAELWSVLRQHIRRDAATA